MNKKLYYKQIGTIESWNKPSYKEVLIHEYGNLMWVEVGKKKSILIIYTNGKYTLHNSSWREL